MNSFFSGICPHVNPCLNGGKCVDKADGYRCECSSEYSGARCANVAHCASPCQNNGNCRNEADGYRCECPSGYKGPECADVDDCAGNPCQNGGTCVDGSASFTVTALKTTEVPPAN